MEKHQLISPSALLDISYILTLVTMHGRENTAKVLLCECFPLMLSYIWI